VTAGSAAVLSGTKQDDRAARWRRVPTDVVRCLAHVARASTGGASPQRQESSGVRSPVRRRGRHQGSGLFTVRPSPGVPRRGQDEPAPERLRPRGQWRCGNHAGGSNASWTLTSVRAPPATQASVSVADRYGAPAGIARMRLQSVHRLVAVLRDEPSWCSRPGPP
jgi:hypothetical protein